MNPPDCIPNREIQNIFLGQIMDLFKKNVQKDGDANTSWPPGF